MSQSGARLQSFWLSFCVTELAALTKLRVTLDKDFFAKVQRKLDKKEGQGQQAFKFWNLKSMHVRLIKKFIRVFFHKLSKIVDANYL